MLKNMNAIAAWAKAKAYTLLHEERGDVNIVSIVVLIGVAVILALLFKDAIGNLLNTLIGSISNNAGNVVNNGSF